MDGKKLLIFGIVLMLVSGFTFAVLEQMPHIMNPHPVKPQPHHKTIQPPIYHTCNAHPKGEVA